MKRNNFTLSDFICPECGNIITLPRLINKERARYHMKKIWCYKCNKEINHIELQNSDFLLKQLQFQEPKTEIEKQVYQLVKKR